MEYTYRTKDTCSQVITFRLEDGVVHDVKFVGGCPGNLQAIPRLVDGMTVDELESRLRGIHCGMKSTSCGDQLAKAVREAYNKENQ